MSGIAIHPALVSLAQLVGLHLHRQRYWGNETTTGHLRQAEEAQLQTCVTFMSSMTPDNASAIDLMKAYEIMAMYYTRLGIPLEGMRWLAHAKKVVETRAIRFVPKYASPSTVAPRSPWQESADDVLERVTVLSQLIFTEVTWKYLNLQPPMSTELERQFRVELLVCSSHPIYEFEADPCFHSLLTQLCSKIPLYFALEVRYFSWTSNSWYPRSITHVRTLLINLGVSQFLRIFFQ